MFTFGPLGRFLREHQDDLYGPRPIIADVAVLRAFVEAAGNVFAQSPCPGRADSVVV